MSQWSFRSRIAAGQSKNDTSRRTAAGGIGRRYRVFMVSMAFTVLVAIAVLSRSVRAEDAVPRIAAIAVARAQIVSGVRISNQPEQRDSVSTGQQPATPKPRKRPCPEMENRACQLIVVDMP